MHIFGGLRFSRTGRLGGEHVLFMFQVGTLPPLQTPILYPGAKEAPWYFGLRYKYWMIKAGIHIEKMIVLIYASSLSYQDHKKVAGCRILNARWIHLVPRPLDMVGRQLGNHHFAKFPRANQALKNTNHYWMLSKLICNAVSFEDATQGNKVIIVKILLGQSGTKKPRQPQLKALF